MSVLYFAAWNTHWAAAVGAEEDLRRRETPVSFLTSLQGKWKTGTQKRQAGQWPGGCPGSIRGSSKGKSGRCQKAMAPAAGVRGGTGKGRSSEREDSQGARETSPCRRVPQVRAPVLGQSGVNAGGSRPQRGWSQSSTGLPALLDLRGLAIIRDDLRPRGPALPQPICLAHSAAAPPTPPPAPAMNGAVARTASTGRAEMT